jgi:hypothetical protein
LVRPAPINRDSGPFRGRPAAACAKSCLWRRSRDPLHRRCVPPPGRGTRQSRLACEVHGEQLEAAHPRTSCGRCSGRRLRVAAAVLASLRGRRRSPHDGIRREGRTICSMATSLSRPPQRADLPFPSSLQGTSLHWVAELLEPQLLPQLAVLCGGRLFPPVRCSAGPHAMEDDAEAAGNRDDGAAEPTLASDLHAPRLKGAPSGRVHHLVNRIITTCAASKSTVRPMRPPRSEMRPVRSISSD